MSELVPELRALAKRAMAACPGKAEETYYWKAAYRIEMLETALRNIIAVKGAGLSPTTKLVRAKEIARQALEFGSK